MYKYIYYYDYDRGPCTQHPAPSTQRLDLNPPFWWPSPSPSRHGTELRGEVIPKSSFPRSMLRAVLLLKSCQGVRPDSREQRNCCCCRWCCCSSGCHSSTASGRPGPCACPCPAICTLHSALSVPRARVRAVRAVRCDACLLLTAPAYQMPRQNELLQLGFIGPSAVQ